ncbi:MAG TPA: transporter substrate-binding protein [Polyangiaceae bacterium]
MKLSRRRASQMVGSALLASALGAGILGCSKPKEETEPAEADTAKLAPIKIGILRSLSGTMAISETVLKDFMLMQVEELNDKGGLLGRKIEPVVVDPASNWPLFRRRRATCCSVRRYPVTVPDIAPSTTELPMNPVLATSETFICRGCYYILDLNRGAPNVPPGTAFDAIVANFRCPDCGTDRSNFRQYQADATLASSA